MNISLTELLAFRNPRCRCLGGLSTEKRITSVVPHVGDLVELNNTIRMSARNQLPDLRGALVVMLGGGREPLTSWRLDATIAQLAAVGASAIVGNFPNGDVPAATIALAERLSFAVLHTEQPWQLSVAARDLLTDSQGPSLTLVRTVITQASRHLDDLDRYIKSVSARIGHELWLVDASGSSSGDEVLDLTQWPRLREALHPVHKVVLEAGRRTLIAVPVRVGQGAQRWLIVDSENLSAAESRALEFGLEAAAIAVAHRLTLRRLHEERGSQQRAFLLGEVLRSGAEIVPTVRAQALDAGWQLEGFHTAIRVLPAEEIDALALRMRVQDVFSRAGLDVAVVEQASGWVAWRTETRPPEHAMAHATRAAIRRVQLELAAQVTVAVGLGGTYPGVGGLATSIREAGEAARLAANRPQFGFFLSFDSINSAQILLARTEDSLFTASASDLLQPLLNENPHLLETLSAFLDQESSVGETAAVLGIHRNTVADRLRRARTLLRMDLDDPDARLAVHLACRALTRAVPSRDH
ncbi:PucR family transcriptional regulator [Streptomyces capillispiralis]|uniref:PucR-like helix-turn-helix protein n=1 Tax=Streptomyces capillispiralis TaxID=68182 RepID=A0A561SGJ1_9ACTN|nr:helix-turn-helix domain-containing protein [Streptomyces capillispiralis]TWF73990.1 PucR-like helix-turn-helix protein [Streptomyces capillispiralis]GHH96320.1 hypothetical protein GCM10017779_67770 [Streptomyces capillispiralis]